MMNKPNYIKEIIRKIAEKTTAGRVIWKEERKGFSTNLTAHPIIGLEATFRLDTDSAYDAEWQRFWLKDGETLLVQIFNPRVLPNAQGGEEVFLVDTLDKVFRHIAVNPRNEKLTKTLDALDKL